MDFVTFEIAKKLKEKGFREECFAHYPICGEDYEEYNCIEDDRCGISLFDLCRCYNNEDSRLIDAPTISQVLKWLREEKRIYVALDFSRFNGNTELWWIYTIRYIEDDSTENIFESCKRKSWEQAAIAGIEYVLENII